MQEIELQAARSRTLDVVGASMITNILRAVFLVFSYGIIYILNSSIRMILVIIEASCPIMEA